MLFVVEDYRFARRRTPKDVVGGLSGSGRDSPEPVGPGIPLPRLCQQNARPACISRAVH